MPTSDTQNFVGLLVALFPGFFSSILFPSINTSGETITTSGEIISATEVDPLTGQNLSPVITDSFNDSLNFNFSDSSLTNLENFPVIFPEQENIALKIGQEEIAEIVAYFDEVAQQFIGSSNNIVEADNGIVAQLQLGEQLGHLLGTGRLLGLASVGAL